MDTSRASARGGIPSAWRPLGLPSPEQVGSEPPRIAHEDQHAGEIPSAVFAGLNVQHARLTVGTQSDRRAHGEPARPCRESHAGIEKDGISRPAEPCVATTDAIAYRLAVDSSTQTDRDALLWPHGVRQSRASLSVWVDESTASRYAI